MASEICSDLTTISDEDLLRRMWQQTEDYGLKREIRAHMYRLRETRLRNFYTTGDMESAGFGITKTPLTTSHGDSLADQSFQSFKTKEIRDSESPTHELKFIKSGIVVPDTSGWNVIKSSEVTPDGKTRQSHSLATTEGVQQISGGTAEYAGLNEHLKKISHEGDDRNFVKSAGESSQIHLQENIIVGDDKSGRRETKSSSSVTSSSNVVTSRHMSTGPGAPDDDQNIIRRVINLTDSPQIQRVSNLNQNVEQLVDRRQAVSEDQIRKKEFQQHYCDKTHQQTHNQRYIPDPASNQEQYIPNKNYSVDTPSQRSPIVRNLQEQNELIAATPGKLLSRTIEYPDPNTKVITETKSLPDGSTVTTKKYETKSASSKTFKSSSNQESFSSSRTVVEDRGQQSRIEYLPDNTNKNRNNVPDRRFPNNTTDQRYPNQMDNGRNTDVINRPATNQTAKQVVQKYSDNLKDQVETIVVENINKTVKKDLSQKIRDEKYADYFETDKGCIMIDKSKPIPERYIDQSQAAPNQFGRTPERLVSEKYICPDNIKPKEIGEPFYQPGNQSPESYDRPAAGKPSYTKPTRPNEDFSTHGYPSVKESRPSDLHPGTKESKNSTSTSLYTDKTTTVRTEETTHIREYPAAGKPSYSRPQQQPDTKSPTQQSLPTKQSYNEPQTKIITTTEKITYDYGYPAAGKPSYAGVVPSQNDRANNKPSRQIPDENNKNQMKPENTPSNYPSENLNYPYYDSPKNRTPSTQYDNYPSDNFQKPQEFTPQRHPAMTPQSPRRDSPARTIVQQPKQQQNNDYPDNKEHPKSTITTRIEKNVYDYEYPRDPSKSPHNKPDSQTMRYPTDRNQVVDNSAEPQDQLRPQLYPTKLPQGPHPDNNNTQPRKNDYPQKEHYPKSTDHTVTTTVEKTVYEIEYPQAAGKPSYRKPDLYKSEPEKQQPTRYPIDEIPKNRTDDSVEFQDKPHGPQRYPTVCDPQGYPAVKDRTPFIETPAKQELKTPENYRDRTIPAVNQNEPSLTPSNKIPSRNDFNQKTPQQKHPDRTSKPQHPFRPNEREYHPTATYEYPTEQKPSSQRPKGQDDRLLREGIQPSVPKPKDTAPKMKEPKVEKPQRVEISTKRISVEVNASHDVFVRSLRCDSPSDRGSVKSLKTSHGSLPRSPDKKSRRSPSYDSAASTEPRNRFDYKKPASHRLLDEPKSRTKSPEKNKSTRRPSNETIDLTTSDDDHVRRPEISGRSPNKISQLSPVRKQPSTDRKENLQHMKQPERNDKASNFKQVNKKRIPGASVLRKADNETKSQIKKVDNIQRHSKIIQEKFTVPNDGTPKKLIPKPKQMIASPKSDKFVQRDKILKNQDNKSTESPKILSQPNSKQKLNKSPTPITKLKIIDTNKLGDLGLKRNQKLPSNIKPKKNDYQKGFPLQDNQNNSHDSEVNKSPYSSPDRYSDNKDESIPNRDIDQNDFNERDDRKQPKSHPPFRRSETYDEKCRQFLGLTDVHKSTPIQKATDFINQEITVEEKTKPRKKVEPQRSDTTPLKQITTKSQPILSQKNTPKENTKSIPEQTKPQRRPNDVEELPEIPNYIDNDQYPRGKHPDDTLSPRGLSTNISPAKKIDKNFPKTSVSTTRSTLKDDTNKQPKDKKFPLKDSPDQKYPRNRPDDVGRRPQSSTRFGDDQYPRGKRPGDTISPRDLLRDQSPTKTTDRYSITEKDTRNYSTTNVTKIRSTFIDDTRKQPKDKKTPLKDSPDQKYPTKTPSKDDTRKQPKDKKSPLKDSPDQKYPRHRPGDDGRRPESPTEFDDDQYPRGKRPGDTSSPRGPSRDQSPTKKTDRYPITERDTRDYSTTSVTATRSTLIDDTRKQPKDKKSPQKDSPDQKYPSHRPDDDGRRPESPTEFDDDQYPIGKRPGDTSSPRGPSRDQSPTKKTDRYPITERDTRDYSTTSVTATRSTLIDDTRKQPKDKKSPQKNSPDQKYPSHRPDDDGRRPESPTEFDDDQYPSGKRPGDTSSPRGPSQDQSPTKKTDRYPITEKDTRDYSTTSMTTTRSTLIDDTRKQPKDKKSPLKDSPDQKYPSHRPDDDGRRPESPTEFDDDQYPIGKRPGDTSSPRGPSRDQSPTKKTDRYPITEKDTRDYSTTSVTATRSTLIDETSKQPKDKKSPLKDSPDQKYPSLRPDDDGQRPESPTEFDDDQYPRGKRPGDTSSPRGPSRDQSPTKKTDRYPITEKDTRDYSTTSVTTTRSTLIDETRKQPKDKKSPLKDSPDQKYPTKTPSKDDTRKQPKDKKSPVKDSPDQKYPSHRPGDDGRRPEYPTEFDDNQYPSGKRPGDTSSPRGPSRDQSPTKKTDRYPITEKDTRDYSTTSVTATRSTLIDETRKQPKDKKSPLKDSPDQKYPNLRPDDDGQRPESPTEFDDDQYPRGKRPGDTSSPRGPSRDQSPTKKTDRYPITEKDTRDYSTTSVTTTRSTLIDETRKQPKDKKSPLKDSPDQKYPTKTPSKDDTRKQPKDKKSPLKDSPDQKYPSHRPGDDGRRPEYPTEFDDNQYPSGKRPGDTSSPRGLSRDQSPTKKTDRYPITEKDTRDYSTTSVTTTRSTLIDETRKQPKDKKSPLKDSTDQKYPTKTPSKDDIRKQPKDKKSPLKDSPDQKYPSHRPDDDGRRPESPTEFDDDQYPSGKRPGDTSSPRGPSRDQSPTKKTDRYPIRERDTRDYSTTGVTTTKSTLIDETRKQPKDKKSPLKDSPDQKYPSHRPGDDGRRPESPTEFDDDQYPRGKRPGDTSSPRSPSRDQSPTKKTDRYPITERDTRDYSTTSVTTTRSTLIDETRKQPKDKKSPLNDFPDQKYPSHRPGDDGRRPESPTEFDDDQYPRGKRPGDTSSPRSPSRDQSPTKKTDRYPITERDTRDYSTTSVTTTRSTLIDETRKQPKDKKSPLKDSPDQKYPSHRPDDDGQRPESPTEFDDDQYPRGKRPGDTSSPRSPSRDQSPTKKTDRYPITGRDTRDYSTTSVTTTRSTLIDDTRKQPKDKKSPLKDSPDQKYPSHRPDDDGQRPESPTEFSFDKYPRGMRPGDTSSPRGPSRDQSPTNKTDRYPIIERDTRDYSTTSVTATRSTLIDETRKQPKDKKSPLKDSPDQKYPSQPPDDDGQRPESPTEFDDDQYPRGKRPGDTTSPRGPSRDQSPTKKTDRYPITEKDTRDYSTTSVTTTRSTLIDETRKQPRDKKSPLKDSPDQKYPSLRPDDNGQRPESPTEFDDDQYPRGMRPGDTSSPRGPSRDQSPTKKTDRYPITEKDTRDYSTTSVTTTRSTLIDETRKQPKDKKSPLKDSPDQKYPSHRPDDDGQRPESPTEFDDDQYPRGKRPGDTSSPRGPSRDQSPTKKTDRYPITEKDTRDYSTTSVTTTRSTLIDETRKQPRDKKSPLKDSPDQKYPSLRPDDNGQRPESPTEFDDDQYPRGKRPGDTSSPRGPSRDQSPTKKTDRYPITEKDTRDYSTTSVTTTRSTLIDETRKQPKDKKSPLKDSPDQKYPSHRPDDDGQRPESPTEFDDDQYPRGKRPGDTSSPRGPSRDQSPTKKTDRYPITEKDTRDYSTTSVTTTRSTLIDETRKQPKDKKSPLKDSPDQKYPSHRPDDDGRRPESPTEFDDDQYPSGKRPRDTSSPRGPSRDQSPTKKTDRYPIIERDTRDYSTTSVTTTRSTLIDETRKQPKDKKSPLKDSPDQKYPSLRPDDDGQRPESPTEFDDDQYPRGKRPGDTSSPRGPSRDQSPTKKTDRYPITEKDTRDYSTTSVTTTRSTLIDETRKQPKDKKSPLKDSPNQKYPSHRPDDDRQRPESPTEFDDDQYPRGKRPGDTSSPRGPSRDQSPTKKTDRYPITEKDTRDYSTTSVTTTRSTLIDDTRKQPKDKKSPLKDSPDQKYPSHRPDDDGQRPESPTEFDDDQYQRRKRPGDTSSPRGPSRDQSPTKKTDRYPITEKDTRDYSTTSVTSTRSTLIGETRKQPKDKKSPLRDSPDQKYPSHRPGDDGRRPGSPTEFDDDQYPRGKRPRDTSSPMGPSRDQSPTKKSDRYPITERDTRDYSTTSVTATRSTLIDETRKQPKDKKSPLKDSPDQKYPSLRPDDDGQRPESPTEFDDDQYPRGKRPRDTSSPRGPSRDQSPTKKTDRYPIIERDTQDYSTTSVTATRSTLIDETRKQPKDKKSPLKDSPDQKYPRRQPDDNGQRPESPTEFDDDQYPRGKRPGDTSSPRGPSRDQSPTKKTDRYPITEKDTRDYSTTSVTTTRSTLIDETRKQPKDKKSPLKDSPVQKYPSHRPGDDGKRPESPTEFDDDQYPRGKRPGDTSSPRGPSRDQSPTKKTDRYPITEKDTRGYSTTSVTTTRSTLIDDTRKQPKDKKSSLKDSPDQKYPRRRPGNDGQRPESPTEFDDDQYPKGKRPGDTSSPRGPSRDQSPTKKTDRYPITEKDTRGYSTTSVTTTRSTLIDDTRKQPKDKKSPLKDSPDQKYPRRRPDDDRQRPESPTEFDDDQYPRGKRPGDTSSPRGPSRDQSPTKKTDRYPITEKDTRDYSTTSVTTTRSTLIDETRKQPKDKKSPLNDSPDQKYPSHRPGDDGRRPQSPTEFDDDQYPRGKRPGDTSSPRGPSRDQSPTKKSDRYPITERDTRDYSTTSVTTTRNTLIDETRKQPKDKKIPLKDSPDQKYPRRRPDDDGKRPESPTEFDDNQYPRGKRPGDTSSSRGPSRDQSPTKKTDRYPITEKDTRGYSTTSVTTTRSTLIDDTRKQPKDKKSPLNDSPDQKYRSHRPGDDGRRPESPTESDDDQYPRGKRPGDTSSPRGPSRDQSPTKKTDRYPITGRDTRDYSTTSVTTTRSTLIDETRKQPKDKKIPLIDSPDQKYPRRRPDDGGQRPESPTEFDDDQYPRGKRPGDTSSAKGPSRDQSPTKKTDRYPITEKDTRGYSTMSVTTTRSTLIDDTRKQPKEKKTPTKDTTGPQNRPKENKEHPLNPSHITTAKIHLSPTVPRKHSSQDLKSPIRGWMTTNRSTTLTTVVKDEVSRLSKSTVTKASVKPLKEKLPNDNNRKMKPSEILQSRISEYKEPEDQFEVVSDDEYAETVIEISKRALTKPLPSKKNPVTERKDSAPVYRTTGSDRDLKVEKMTRSTSDNLIKTTVTRKSKPDIFIEPSSRKSSIDKTHKIDRRPNKCMTTKTINLTTNNLIHSEDMENVIIDIQQAKSSREPTPNKIVPTPVHFTEETGTPRYPDTVSEPDEEQKRKPKVKHIPIFEEDRNQFVGCEITEVEDVYSSEEGSDVPSHVPKEKYSPDKRPKYIDETDECLLSVHEKVNKFTTTAEEVTRTKPSAPFQPEYKEPNFSEPDDCLLSVNAKVSKFLITAEQNASTVKPNEVKKIVRPKLDEIDEHLRTDECILSVSEKVNKFISSADKLSEPFPQKSPGLVANIERQVLLKDSDDELEPTQRKPEKTKFETNSPITERYVPHKIKSDTKTPIPSSPILLRSTETVRKAKSIFENREESTTKQKDILSRPSIWEGRKMQEPHRDDYEVPKSPEPMSSDDNPQVVRLGRPTTEQVSPLRKTPKVSTPSDSVSSKKDLYEKRISTINRTGKRDNVVESRTTKTVISKRPTDQDTNIHPEIRPYNKPNKNSPDVDVNQRGIRIKTKPEEIKSPTAQPFKKLDKFHPHRGSESSLPRDYDPRRSATPESVHSSRPSYMEHTVSSLEHRRGSTEVVRTYTSTSPDRKLYSPIEPSDGNPRSSVKFGVELKRTDSSDGSVRRKSSTSEIPHVEEIFDLDLLERMLETVVGYEQRRRIRSQIRVVKKMSDTEITRITAKKTTEKYPTRKPNDLGQPRKNDISPARKTTTSVKGPNNLTENVRTSSSTRLIEKESRHVISHEDYAEMIEPIKIKTTTTVTEIRKVNDRPTSSKPDTSKERGPKDDKPIWATKNILKKPSENNKPTKASTVKRTTTTTKTTTPKQQKPSPNEDCITSSYGIGPTDENGLPLFGIRALKKKPQPPSETTKTSGTVITEKYYSENGSDPVGERKVTTYTNVPDDIDDMELVTYDSDEITEKIMSSDGVTMITKTRKIGTRKDVDLTEIPSTIESTIIKDGKIVRRGSVKEMSEKFIRKESSSSVTEKASSRTYPKAGLILRTHDRRSGSVDYDDVEPEYDVDMCSSLHTQTMNESGSESELNSREVRTTRSFLNSAGTKVSGVHDVIERMKSADYVIEDGDTVEDHEARSLLNKFLGASVLMTGIESVVPKEVTTTTIVSSPNRSKQEVTTTRVTKTIKSGGDSSSPVTCETCDIEEISDEELLKQLLEQSTNYEERRKIRARLRQIMAEREAKTAEQLKKETSSKDKTEENVVKKVVVVEKTTTTADKGKGGVIEASDEEEEIIEEVEETDESAADSKANVDSNDDDDGGDDEDEYEEVEVIEEIVEESDDSEDDTDKDNSSKKVVKTEKIVTTKVIKGNITDGDNAATTKNIVESKKEVIESKQPLAKVTTAEKDSVVKGTESGEEESCTTKTTETKKGGAVVTTTTKVTTRTVSGTSKPVSPFAKFRQLDKQNLAQSPTNSPTTQSTPTAPGGIKKAEPLFKFTDPALNARAATVKEQLLQWCQMKTKEYENVQITNFSTSWSDGLAFCALIHHFLPDAFDYSKLTPQQRRHNFELAFRVADEKAGIAPLLDVEDMVVMRRPDWKCVFTYVQTIYRRFRNSA